MKKLVLAYIVWFSIGVVGSATAQSISLGARGGISLPNLTNGDNSNPLSAGYSSRLASDFAVTCEFHLSKLISLKPMIEFSQQGGKKDGLQAFTTPEQLAPYVDNQPYVYADYNSTAKMNYLLIPVLVKFHQKIDQKSPFRFYFDVGPFAGYLLSAHQITSGSSFIYLDQNGEQPFQVQGITPHPSFDNDEDIKDQLHNFNLGISGNIGVAYTLGSGSIFIEGGGNYGFINIQKHKKDGTNHTGAATVSIGYSHKIRL